MKRSCWKRSKGGGVATTSDRNRRPEDEMVRNDAMRHTADPNAAVPKLLAACYAPVDDALERVEKLLETALRGKDARVNELVRYGFRASGKRLRPAMLLLSAKAVGEINADHLTLAAVVEMVHTATLIHDDVLDEATLRRHHETVNARWDNETSVLLGDFLFTHAFYLASTLPTNHACRVIGRTTNIVCEGELRQIAHRGRYEMTETTYLEIIEAKTASLCACCCELGAHYASASRPQEEALRQFGHHLGIAFQIADDLLDLLGDEPTVGKSLGTDLGKQKPTLPVIEAMRRVPAAQRSELLSALTNGHGRAAVLLPWLERFGAVDYARNKATQHARQARDCLLPLPESPARQRLECLADFVVMRQQ